MKKFGILCWLAATFLFSSATLFAQHDGAAKKQKQLVILCYDISASTQSYAILKEEHLRAIFDKVAYNGGGAFASIFIKANSTEQEVFEYPITAADTLALTGNPMLNNKIKARNKKIREAKDMQQADFISKAKYILLPKNEGKTDVFTTLRLAKISAEQPLYNSHNKTLIFVSDGQHTKTGTDKTPVSFDSTKVILVRTTDTSCIKGKPVLANTIQSAIEMIINQ